VIFRPFYYFDTGCAAYVLGCAGKGHAAVVDPQDRDLDNYINFSAAKAMRITHVIDTHIHADHISGGRKLAERTGAAYCLHESAQTEFPFSALRNGQEIPIGNVTARVLHTPGHTPESICLLISDNTRGREPWFLLTGDTLFVGSVGRPDLTEHVEQSARELYRSIQTEICSLPDNLEVYPAHFAGSVCGKGMSGKPMSTLGYEKRFNPMLCSPCENGFVTAIAETILPELANKADIIRRNEGKA
jgi:glyoxylase-like metal-dependent hydrolase (beta-lactamase superfamily II)